MKYNNIYVLGATNVDETPHNRSIVSVAPNSAPPKINSINENHISDVQHLSTVAEESLPAESVHFSHDNDEETVMSVGSDTPKGNSRLYFISSIHFKNFV